ncbi:MAG: TolA protein [Saprospiraceae bacterium]|jgi:TolA protein
MDAITLRQQETEAKNKKSAKILSISIHTLLLIVLIFGFTKSCETLPPPKGNEGIMIAFGDPNAGGGYEEPVETEEAEAEEAEEVEAVETPAPSEPTSTPETKPEVKTADSDEVAIKKKREAAKKKVDADAKRKADAKKKSDAKKKADAKKKSDAKKKADAEARAKALAEAKAKAGGKFNKPGSGSGSNSGNAGDPNSTNTGTGGGTTGTGDGNVPGRNMKAKPNPPKNPGINGTAVIKICVDPKGNVVSADFTQKGSSITSDAAIKEAIANAKKWKFDSNPMAPDKQCGTVTYQFKVK